MAVYNFTPMESTNPIVVFDFLHASTGNLMGAMFLVAIFFIAMITLKNFPASKSIAASSFITAVFGIIMFSLGWIEDWIIFGVIALAALTIGWLYFTRSE